MWEFWFIYCLLWYLIKFFPKKSFSYGKGGSGSSATAVLKGNGNEDYLAAVFFVTWFFITNTLLFIRNSTKFFHPLIWKKWDICILKRQNTGIAAACFATAIFFGIFILFLKIFPIILTAMFKKVFDFTDIWTLRDKMQHNFQNSFLAKLQILKINPPSIRPDINPP